MSDDRETAPSTAESWAVETAIVASIDTDATVRPQTDVGRAATGGVLWLTAQKWVVRLFSFVTIAILTRLLAPEDFGTLAAASTVLPFFYLLADLGFAAYIVQVAKTTERMLSTAFWFSLVAGIVLCGLLWLGAPLMGQVFGNETVAPVLQALSIWVVITAVGSVPTAIVRRQMRFAVIAAQGAAAAVIAQIVALILAFTGFGSGPSWHRPSWERRYRRFSSGSPPDGGRGGRLPAQSSADCRLSVGRCLASSSSQ